MALIICDECGSQVSDKATVCPQCGAPISHKENIEFGSLKIVWRGKWMIANTPIHVSVNGNKIGEYAFMSDFDIDVPITSKNTLVELKCGFRSNKQLFMLSPKTDYTLNIQYSRFTGGFGFYLTDENSGTIKKDSLGLLVAILCFLFPIIGLVYGFYVKNDKPAASNAAIVVSICGFVLWLFLVYSHDL